jgi:hypothetical protein
MMPEGHSRANMQPLKRHGNVIYAVLDLHVWSAHQTGDGAISFAFHKTENTTDHH